MSNPQFALLIPGSSPTSATGCDRGRPQFIVWTLRVPVACARVRSAVCGTRPNCLFYYCAYYDHCVQGFKSPGLIIFFWFGPFAGRVSTLSRSVNVCRFAWCRPPASAADPSRGRLPPETTPTLSLAWVERAVVSTRGWPKFDGQPLGSWSAAFLGSCPVPAVSQ